ncbi:MAG: VCBS repeat-containing protein [Verrucomicrobia bacterium]|nr:VCBS repeat-containing protein [Verrucomicrobiota bacterium]
MFGLIIALIVLQNLCLPSRGASRNNSPPTITPVADKVITVDDIAVALVRVGDDATPPQELTLSGTSSNPNMIPDGNITFGGLGTYRTITIVPAPRQTGSAKIMVSVSDGSLSTNVSFEVTIVERPPIGPQVVYENQSIPPKNYFSLGNGFEFGDQVFLSGKGTGRWRVTDFLFDYYLSDNANGDERGELRIYPNDGPDGRPGSAPIYKSSAFSLKKGFSSERAAGLSLTVPDTFTWTVVFTGIDTNEDMGLLLASTPATGSSPDDFWIRKIDGTWSASLIVIDGGTPANFGATVYAVSVSAQSPTISFQPESQTAVRGANVTLYVTALGLPPLGYQWQFNGSDVPGATNSILTMTGVKKADSGDYIVSVRNNAGGAMSQAAKLTIVPGPKDDFNLDGLSDLVFQDAENYLGVWLMNRTNRASGGFLVPDKSDASYRLVGTGDFNQDLQPDLLLHLGDGTLEVWFMQGTNRMSRSFLAPGNPGDQRWRVAGTGDFDLDSKTDLLFQHEDGTLAVWFMDGTKLTNASLTNPSIPEESLFAVGVGDFTGESRDEILLAGKDRSMAIWKMEGTNRVGTVWLKPVAAGDGDWQVVRPLDMDGDKKTDLVVQRSDQSLEFRFLEGTNLVSRPGSKPLTVEGTWRLIGPAFPTNVWPRISFIPDQITYVDKATKEIGFTVADADTPVTNLVVASISSNPQLVPSTNIVVLGNGTNRTMIINPAPQQKGTVRITVTVSDGLAKASSAFELKVNSETKDDFNLDGLSDLVFQDAENYLGVWLMNGTNRASGGFLVPDKSDASYRLVGTGDFNQDLRPDLLFQDEEGTLAIWLMNQTRQRTGGLIEPRNPGDQRWRVAGTGDFNLDSKTDLLFQHEDGTLAVWLMEGMTLTNATLTNPSVPEAGLIAVGVADFSGDGRDDILLAGKDRSLAIWRMEGTKWVESIWLKPVEAADGNWQVVRPLDMDGDKKMDLVVQRSDQSVEFRFLEGTNLVIRAGSKPLTVEGTWRLIGPAVPAWPTNLAPIVRIVAPTNGETFFVGQAIPIAASASDSDGRVTRVEFFAATNSTSNLISIATNASVSGTYTNAWTNAPAGSHTLTVAATDDSGVTRTSAPISITVFGPPTITAQPQGKMVPAGTNVTLTVTATSALPLSYQWRKDGVNIPDARSATLILPSVQKTDAGNYSVVVSNSAGQVTSADASLEVNVVFRFSQDVLETTEDASLLRIPVHKVGAAVAAVSYSVTIGTAEPGRDYRLEPGRLNFGANEESRDILLTLLDDFILDGTKQLTITLTSPSNGATLGMPYVATIFIIDDEKPVTPTLFAQLILPEDRKATGRLQVYLEPTVATNAAWRLPWELVWHESGEILGNLDVGNYPLEFRPIADYREPEISEEIPVLNQRDPTVRTFLYRRDAARPSGSLVVRIGPPEVLHAPVPGPGWRLRGERSFFTNAYRLGNLPPGTNYILEFQAVRDWTTPPARLVTVLANLDNVVTATYSPAQPVAPEVYQPVPLRTYQAIEDGVSEPLRRPLSLMGQLRSAAGYGSGIAVRKRVVLTAAHVLFDESTTNLVSEITWHHELHAGDYDPRPIRAIGWAVFEEYLKQRRSERERIPPSGPTPASQQWDVAAIYFGQDIALHGESGFLLSDTTDNEWLATAKVSFLGGYPLTGQADNRLHAIESRKYLFARASGRLFSSSQFVSYPGNSGGPLCVLAGPVGDPTFYPAAVYLGNLDDRSVVRAIDSEVAQLINRAASSAELGTNFTGGGVLVLNPPVPGVRFGVQKLTIRLQPREAVAAGAGWRVSEKGGAFTGMPEATTDLVSGVNYTVEFKSVPGWLIPTNFSVNLPEGQDAELTVTYERDPSALPVRWIASSSGLFVSGAVGIVVDIEFTPALGALASWTKVRTVTLEANPVFVIGPPWTPNPAGYYRAKW